MDFRQAVLELSRLEGQTVLFQVRAFGDDAIIFQMLDRIDRVSLDERAGRAVFFDAESSLLIREAAFGGAEWGAGWQRGDEDERQLCMRVGPVELAFLPS